MTHEKQTGSSIPEGDDSHEPVDPSIIKLGGLEINAGYDSSEVLAVGADIGLKRTLLCKDVAITNVWHLSREEIRSFETREAEASAKRYGDGTYVGGGEQTGTQIRELQRDEHFNHQLRFEGTALFVPFDESFDLQYYVAELHDGLDDSRGIGPRTITDTLRELGADNQLFPGVAIDAVFFYADGEGLPASSEGIVFDAGTHLQTEAITHVSGTQ